MIVEGSLKPPVKLLEKRISFIDEPNKNTSNKRRLNVNEPAFQRIKDCSCLFEILVCSLNANLSFDACGSGEGTLLLLLKHFKFMLVMSLLDLPDVAMTFVDR
jgi:hypothetical protein